MKTAIKKYIPYTLGQKMRGLWQKTQGLYYRGSDYYCPFCKNNFRKLLPGGFDLDVITKYEIIGGGRRMNNVCPRCYSTDRDRLLYLFFTYKSDLLNSKKKVFHVAPSGALKSYLSSLNELEYYTGTKHHDGFYYAKNIEIHDITQLSFETGKFDVVICNHVLEHVIDDRTAMKEIYRVLKPGGWAVLQVPLSKQIDQTYEDDSITEPADREKYFGQFDHVRIYGPDYINRLEGTGFKVKTYNPYSENWDVSDIEKFAINKKEDVYVAYK